MSVIKSRLTAFTSAQSGSISLLFGLLALVFFSLIGAAVDYSRWSNMKGRTADALDAALLAGGRALQTQMTPAEAIEVAKKNFAENAKKLNVIEPQVTISVTDNGQSLEGVAWAKMKTPFLGLVKTKSLKVAANSKVGFSIGQGSAKGGSDLEISLMLDVTGSMCADGNGPCATSPKMDALKSAAGDLVNIIIKASNGNSSARIALVPFSTRVRLGAFQDPQTETLMKQVTDLPKDWSGWYMEETGCGGSWSGGGSEGGGSGTWSCSGFIGKEAVKWSVMPCVVDRTGPEEFTDTKPQSNAWLIGHGGSRFPQSNDSSDDPYTWSGQGTIPFPPAAKADLAYQWEYSPWDCADIDPANSVMPLSSDKTALLSKINSLVAYGSTSGALGTAWSWYTLSPEWNNIWTGTSQPGSYADMAAVAPNPPKLRKIAVLMTDGVYNTHRGWKDQDPDMVSNNAKQICTNMKAKGIEVYTVGFDLDSLPAAEKTRATDVLQSCGTDIQHFYDAMNAEQLKTSFRDIALQLSQLFVAK